MPDSATEERRQILRAFGAEIVESPHQKGLLGTIACGRGAAFHPRLLAGQPVVEPDQRDGAL
jgi:cysteine synthase